MTTIQIKCTDQRLQVLNAPVISSGGSQETCMQFEFGSKWEGYGKTAVFYRTKYQVYNVVLDYENKCVVPDEVLESEGRFYFGIYGVKEGVRKTTDIMKYDVIQGAYIEGETPIEPTRDIYEQILSAYGNNTTKVEQVARETALLGEMINALETECEENFEEDRNRIRKLEVFELEVKQAPTLMANSVLNNITGSGVFRFVYDGKPYLMWHCTNGEAWVQYIYYVSSSNGDLNLLVRENAWNNDDGEFYVSVEDKGKLISEKLLTTKLNEYLAYNHAVQIGTLSRSTNLYFTITNRISRELTLDEILAYITSHSTNGVGANGYTFVNSVGYPVHSCRIQDSKLRIAYISNADTQTVDIALTDLRRLGESIDAF